MNRYLVVTIRKPTFRESAIASHHAFLARLREEGRPELAGPFGDRSGGACVLKARSLAQALADPDPVYATGSSRATVYEWNAS